MGRLAGFSGRDVRRVAERDGWQFLRQCGDHMVFYKPGVRENLSIPDHREIAEGLLRALLRKMGMTVAEFLQRAR